MQDFLLFQKEDVIQLSVSNGMITFAFSIARINSVVCLSSLTVHFLGL